MPHSYSRHPIHLTFSTKNRIHSISEEMQPRLWSYVAGIALNHEIPIRAVGGISNHIHICYDLPAKLDASKVVQIFKANSSRWMREHQDFEWQEGFGSFGVSESNVPAVIKYIENQPEHHRRRSFEDEFLALLKKHNVKYDPRFVFG